MTEYDLEITASHPILDARAYAIEAGEDFARIVREGLRSSISIIEDENVRRKLLPKMQTEMQGMLTMRQAILTEVVRRNANLVEPEIKLSRSESQRLFFKGYYSKIMG